ncbi:izumo sperm-egg fusion protein 1 isoform X2 [Takifugu rubripes]|uniref:izumo sperm-egg fusion protein 1 isoform X2 n=1 Tax=Takifugu rubripes TaxID=31033 RepID=UPI001145DD29|nr:izumo sperm-egg fusion protein 1 isoform X2 [Takifugu rubripes]
MLSFFYLLCCVSAVKTCLQCDRRIRHLHDNFILSAPSIADQIELKKICDHAYATYKDASLEREGLIDVTTLYRVRTEYESEFDRFLKTPNTGSVTFGAIQIFDKGREILEKHLDKFILEGLCPNKCGLLERRLIECSSCKTKKHTCASGQLECGENTVHADEGGQAVLNCLEPWHRLLKGKPEYHYSWAPSVPGTKTANESDFKVLVVTEDSSLVLNQLRVDEQGTYHCSLQDRNGTVFYQVKFLLSVSPLPIQTVRSFITLPPLPLEDDFYFGNAETFLVPFLAVVTVLSLTAVVGLTVFMGLMVNKWSDVEELDQSSVFA